LPALPGILSPMAVELNEALLAQAAGWDAM